MRYLIIPKSDPATAGLSAIDVRLDQQSRRRQYHQLLELRRQPSGVEDTVTAGARSAVARAAPILAQPTAATPVTGITIVEASSQEAAELGEELTDSYVIPDLPLTLIEPEQAAGSHGPDPQDLWHLDAIGLRRIREDGFDGRGSGIVVAVADTGIEEVPEIQGRIESAHEIDQASGQLVPLAATLDTDGHGTHVAGLICGSRVGVAPGASLMNIVMIPRRFGHVSDFVLTIEFVASQPQISILNMSAGIPGYHGEMQIPLQNLRRAGVLPVIAVGNEGRNTSRSPGNYRSALSVGASSRDGRVAAFSGGGQMAFENMHYEIPHLVAPGQNVTSCVMGGGYEAWHGTSMATPIVSGLAALILERRPDIDIAHLEDELLRSCSDLGEVANRQGAGLLQCPALLAAQGVV